MARATGSAVAEASSQKKAKPAPQREYSEVKAMDVNEGRKEIQWVHLCDPEEQLQGTWTSTRIDELHIYST